MTLTLLSLPLNTPISAIKTQIQTHLGGASSVSSIDKIKILLNKKPIPSTKKTLEDAFQGVEEAEGKEEVSLGVMVMGGARDPVGGNGEVVIDMAKGATAEGAGDGEGKRDVPPAAAVDASAPGSEKAQAQAQTQTQPATSDAMEGVEQGDSHGDWQDELTKPEFWTDLEGFLQQRLKSQVGGKKFKDIIEQAWRADLVRINT
jgi:hypothetical protein